MKTTTLRILAAAGIMAVTAACSGSKEPSALIAQSDRIEGELATLTADSPMFLQETDAEYEDGNLDVSIDFSDPTISVDKLDEPLVQYVMAMYLKSHTGKDLDVVLNTLASEEGQLILTLEDVNGQERQYPMNAASLKRLVREKPMNLKYNDAKDNLVALLEARCDSYKEQYNALECEFSLTGGFAQYTLTFERATAFANLTQASLTGRYVKILKPRYEDFGACRTMVEDLMRSFGIDGYRFVYTDKAETNRLAAGIPWRTLNQ